MNVRVTRNTLAFALCLSALNVVSLYSSLAVAQAVNNKTNGSKYFVIQNIATERMRIYERCTETPDCAHRMVMETEFVAGRTEGPKRDRDRFQTWLGLYKITSWVKFYEDQMKHYPSWYDPKYPEAPSPQDDPQSWFNKKFMPNPGTGSMRGAFGWYAGLVGPNANYQWIHGTIGWGSQKNKFIKYTRSFWVNLVANPRSSGCTRLENEAVAYTQYLLPVGTEVLRVYAKEGIRDESLTTYQNQSQPAAWDYILTNEHVRSKVNVTSAKDSVLARQVSESQILESGTYQIDQVPNGIGFTDKPTARQRQKGNSGNAYGVPSEEMKGVLLIDEGRLVDYEHPKSLTVGGLKENNKPSLPESYKTGGTYSLFKPKYDNSKREQTSSRR